MKRTSSFNAVTSDLLKFLITMTHKTLLALSTVVPAVLASPASPVHKRQVDLETFIQNEKPIARQGVLNNIGDDGKLVQGAYPGIAVASPSNGDPTNCMLPQDSVSSFWQKLTCISRLLHLDP